MPVQFHGAVSAAAASAGKTIAKQLAGLCAQHFAHWRGIQPGLGGASCCAAVAINPLEGVAPAANSPFAGGGALAYAVSFGNSQMAAGGLVHTALANFPAHAERAAIATASGTSPLYTPNAPPNDHHFYLYVELAPCAPCQAWLAGTVNPGAAENPMGIRFAHGSPDTLHVWNGWAYNDAGVNAMQNFHDQTIANQLAAIAGW